MAIATRNAEDIKKDVVDQMYWDSRVDAANVQVEVLDDRVILTGTVPTIAARHAADDDTWQVEGVRAVENRLEIERPTETPIASDETIASRVADTLLWHPDIDSSDITPVVSTGQVTLKGSVGSYWQKMLAEELAGSLSDVFGVTNELAVVPSKDITDQSIGRAIVSALERNAYVDPDQVNVEVANGVVTLSGAVPNLMVYRAALDAARHTVGVVNVINDLTFA